MRGEPGITAGRQRAAGRGDQNPGPLSYSVNGAQSVTVAAPGSGSRGTPATLTISVVLTAGVNTLTLTGPAAVTPAPDIDRIQLS
ncbi:hypothetical protein [Kitasatospora sp. NPDC057015]|uniref:hypothetical protein n=1 Tax=Kitasatospora sp. NPDC057015 TaxID=3346001 RepID=UPI0036433267